MEGTMAASKTPHLRDGVAHFNPVNPVATIQVADTIAERFTSDDVLLRRADLKRLGIHYSNAHLLRLEARGLFPRRVRLTPGKGGKVAWKEREVLDWLNARAAARATDTYADCAY
jgi:predicted DNA-binding transcriptional regulator AlpA